MASLTSKTASRDAQITDPRSHQIKLGRLGDFADCPVFIDDDDDIRDTATHAEYQAPDRSSPHSPISPSSSRPSLSSLRSSFASSPPPPAIPSAHISLRGTSDNGSSHDRIYIGIDGPKKTKRRRTSCRAALKAIDSNMQEQLLTKPIEDVDTNRCAGAAFKGEVPDVNLELLHTSAEDDIVLEGELLAVYSTEADLKCQATSLEVGASSNPRGTNHTLNFRQSS
ncbi:hypothetical protein BKA61DRAFT_732616 [Leptodontidium sp. MPI-SDFR-AT-0119]|nr:hypothetical protein BKA61DRAFT_732616 [Leptodontidium sp. MPI-SDFR-AT-0119]